MLNAIPLRFVIFKIIFQSTISILILRKHWIPTIIDKGAVQPSIIECDPEKEEPAEFDPFEPVPNARKGTIAIPAYMQLRFVYDYHVPWGMS